MKILNCFFGQVRECANGNSPYHLPNDLSSIITEQQVYTWNNTTGMNPLENTVPDIYKVSKFSYGAMLANTYSMGNSSIVNLIEKMRPHEYDNKIKEDYYNVYCGLAKILGRYWLKHHILNRTQDFDYVIMRQMDTHFGAELTTDKLMAALENDPFHYIPMSVRRRTPIIYAINHGHSPQWFNSLIHPRSYCYIFNKQAVAAYKDVFYKSMLAEYDYYCKFLGWNNAPSNGQPGIIFARAAIKNNIELLTIPIDTVMLSSAKTFGTASVTNIGYSGLVKDK